MMKVLELICAGVRKNFVLAPHEMKPYQGHPDYEDQMRLPSIVLIGLADMHCVDDKEVKTELNIEEKELRGKKKLFNKYLNQAANSKEISPEIKRFAVKTMLVQQFVYNNRDKLGYILISDIFKL